MKNVSILLVSYNAEKYIKKTIQSCLNQTYDNFEIFVLDNNSKDNTVEIIKSLGDEKIKLFESDKNLGPYNGLNFLLDKADGEYIAIQDHDDIWFPRKIEMQVEFLEKNKDFVACGTSTFYYYESKEILILNKKSRVTNFVDHTSLMFRNKNFRYNINFTLTDEHFEKKVLNEVGKIACLQDALTIHRIKKDGTNLSSQRFNLRFKNIKEFFKVNGLSISSLTYLIDLIISRYIPESFIWIIRKKITQKKSYWIGLNKFKSKHSNIDL